MKTYTKYMTVEGITVRVDFAVHEAELPHTTDEIEIIEVWVSGDEVMSIIDEKILDEIADEILKGGDDE